MNTLNLEQVKEHFKYAKEVRCVGKSIYEGHLYEIDLEDAHYGDGKFKDNVYCQAKQGSANGDCMLYKSDTNQLAEILTYIFDRGEEVEVSNDSITWFKNLFIGFTKSNEIVSEYENDNGIGCYKFVRKLTPESLLEPELTAFKKKAKEMNCTVTVIFENK